MSRYSDFFLNSDSNIVQLELLEISHPFFSRVWRIVRNSVAGVTVTLEDSTLKTFDYYPIQIVPTGAYNDLDNTLEVTFGDLGEILPLELDRLVPLRVVPVNAGCLVGAWVDATGQLVVPPFLVGNGGNFYVPYQAVALQLGINDLVNGDNAGSWNVSIDGAGVIAVNGTSRPWTTGSGINDDFPIAPTGSAAPTSIAVTPGDFINIAVTGMAGIISTNLRDGLGDPTQTGRGAGEPGSYIADSPIPGTNTKPVVIYRTYRSDDLTAPLAGPYFFKVNNIAFKLEGATLQCTPRRLNLVATGELYTMDRFPMLRGFL